MRKAIAERLAAVEATIKSETQARQALAARRQFWQELSDLGNRIGVDLLAGALPRSTLSPAQLRLQASIDLARERIARASGTTHGDDLASDGSQRVTDRNPILAMSETTVSASAIADVARQDRRTLIETRTPVQRRIDDIIADAKRQIARAKDDKAAAHAESDVPAEKITDVADGDPHSGVPSAREPIAQGEAEPLSEPGTISEAELGSAVVTTEAGECLAAQGSENSGEQRDGGLAGFTILREPGTNHQAWVAVCDRYVRVH